MRILLTGAGGKFGEAFIDRLADTADIIALRHDKNAPELPRTFRPDEATPGPKLRSVGCDFHDAEDIWRAVSAIVALAGPIDHIVNAAADVRFLGSTVDIALHAVEACRQIEANTLAPAVVVSSVFHHDWKQRSPADASVLNISSMSAHQVYGGVGQGLYAASKSALNTLTLHTAWDLRPYGIRVNALSPDTFPAALSTAAVVDAALKILAGKTTGHIFQLAARTTSAP